MKTPNHRQLAVIQSKLRQQNPKLYRTNDYWGICATPTEILILVDVYRVATDKYDSWVEFIRDRKDRGECNPLWFYFHAGPKKMIEIFGNKKHEVRRHGIK